MEGSTSIRLRAFLEQTGTKHRWLAEQLYVSKSLLSEWLSGAKPVPEAHRVRILEALRERQELDVPGDLFYRED